MNQNISAALAATLSQILQNPEELKLIEEELDSELFDGEKPTPALIKEKLTRDGLKNLDHLSAVVKESLRISPTIYGKVQVAQKELFVDGFKISKGTKIFPCSGVIGMSNAVWKEPSKFVPERYDDTSDWSMTPSGEKRQAQAWLAFGSGPRACMGDVYTMDHIKVTLIYMLSLYEWQISGHAPTDDHFYFCTENDFKVTYT